MGWRVTTVTKCEPEGVALPDRSVMSIRFSAELCVRIELFEVSPGNGDVCEL